MTSKKEENTEIGLYNITPEKYSQSTSTLAESESSKETISITNHDPDTSCGYGSWTPQWIQKAAEPKLFLFSYSMAGIMEGAPFTYFVGCLSTVEKRFAYDSTMSSYILITSEISSVIFGVFVGYFGGLTHRPRILTYGMLMGALGCFTFAFPYYIYGSGRLDDNVHGSESQISGINAQFCSKDFNETEESCSKSAAIPVVTFFFIGSFLRSIANVVFYSVGPSYVDDNIKKENSPLYFGTIFAFRLLSPVVGFLLSSLCLQFYENPLHDPGFDSNDPRWVGAWWLGFIILGILIIVFSVPMILFPRRFPQKKILPSLQKKKAQEESKSTIHQLKSMVKAMKRLMKNPILMCHYLGTVLRLNGICGYYLLLPKYMEMQFRQSASKASLYSGPASIIGMQLGIIIGGVSISKFRPCPRVLTGGIVIAESFNVLALVSCMLITCPVDQMAGTSAIDIPVKGFATLKTLNVFRFNLKNECNMDCNCTTKVYTPICGPGGKTTYFSPCFAGCKGYNKTENKEVFTNCKCVHDEHGDFTVGQAKKDYCGYECQWLITFVVILSLGKLLGSTARVGNAIVTLRCVEPEDKSIALGASTGIFALLAFIPYPLIYGALTDASCLVWEESCGKTGNCWVYDTDKFRYLLHGVSAAFVFVGCLTDVLVWILSPRLRNLYDDDDDEKENSSEDIAEAEVFNNYRVLE